jgi:hypothetical protein
MKKPKACFSIIKTEISGKVPKGTEPGAEVYGIGSIDNGPFEFFQISCGCQ